ncbi:MAG: hypothetical protein EZS28_031715, partial [Streblomastix strix]
VFLVYHIELGIIAAKVMKNEDFIETEWDATGIFVQDPPQIRPFIISNILAKKFKSLTNLKSLIEANIDIPLSIIRAIMNQLLEALRYIHSKGLIHRDIKPANILLHNPPGTGRVICKIADFGEMKVKSQIDQSTNVQPAGTLVYMPPELLLGDGDQFRKADEKIDIWSLGIILYQIVYHTFPFRTPSFQSIQSNRFKFLRF